MANTEFLSIKQEPFLNIDDEQWYQRIDCYLGDIYLYSRLKIIETGRV